MIDAGAVLAGRYRLEQRIAGGGMGDVWRGFDRVLGRTVAVKCLRDAPPDEPGFVDRFRAEARTMATISHPGVVEVYDFGDDPAVGMYLVMKYIDGESLAQALARNGRLNPRATMRLVAEAAEALHAAHEKGVTHRDVKPGNLLLCRDGSTVLTDFGIARSAGADGHTSTGSLLGTAGYIAPERAHGQPSTARSDIYSLGVVAYQCLAGRLPFTGDSVVELALRHAHDEPPPLPADIPPSVRAVVERAMAKDPAARWPTAAVLAAQARHVMTATPSKRQTVVAAPTRSEVVSNGRTGRGLLVAGLAALVVAIIATVVIVLGLGGDPQTHNPAAGPGATDPAEIAGGTIPAANPSRTGPTAISGGTTPAAPGGTTPVGAAGAPAAPTNLTATPISANTIRLQWTDNSANEDGFTIHNGAVAKDVGANTTTYDWTGLLAATYSCFKVRAFNASGVSSYYPSAQSDWVCATSLSGTGPSAPSNLSATPTGPNTIRLQWTDNSSDEDGFTITNGNTSRNAGANTTSYDWDGLAANTYMCFKIRSYRPSGVSSYYPAAQSDWICATTPAG